MTELQGASWGALFDWDGVVVDSKELHLRAWNEAAAHFGYPHSETDFGRHFGSKNQRAIAEILRWTTDPSQVVAISDYKEQRYRTHLAETPDIVIESTRSFLRELKRREVPCAVVSSSPLENIQALLAADPGGREGAPLAELFLALVSSEDVQRGKPDPEAFLLGAERLGIAPGRCVVFEDAPAGVQAGLAAQMRVVGLTTTHAASELASAHHVADALDLKLLRRLESGK